MGDPSDDNLLAMCPVIINGFGTRHMLNVCVVLTCPVIINICCMFVCVVPVSQPVVEVLIILSGRCSVPEIKKCVKKRKERNYIEVVTF